MKKLLGSHYRYWPEEILFNIFSHLSAEDLSYLKCVSKRWRSLMSSPNFVRTHLILSRSKLQNQIVFQTIEKPPNCDYFVYRHFSTNNIIEQMQTPPIQLKLNVPGNQQKLALSLEACCDGLLLFQDKNNPRQLYLSNPTTGHIRALPLTLMFPRRSWAIVRDTTCLGKYNVFGLKSSIVAMVLSVGGTADKTSTTSDWRWFKFRERTLGATHHVLSQLTVIDNDPHWLSIDKNQDGQTYYYVQQINIDTKTFCSTEVPLQLLKPSNIFELTSNNGLHLLSDMGGGSICLTIVSSHQLQMFVLEDRINFVWAKYPTINLHSLWNLPSLVNGFLSCNICIIALRGVDAPGSLLNLLKILVHHEGQLWLYELKTKVMKAIGILSDNQKLCRQYYFHSNSLLWWD